MCAQQLIWCICGHGEFLPIEKCPRAIQVGYCWTVVWGDEEVVIPDMCSYCKAGYNDVRRLGSARPPGKLKESAGEGLAIGSNGQVKGAGKLVLDPALVGEDVGAQGAEPTATAPSSSLSGPEEPSAKANDELPEQPDELEFDWNDIVNTDFSDGFNLNDDMWGYAWKTKRREGPNDQISPFRLISE